MYHRDFNYSTLTLFGKNVLLLQGKAHAGAFPLHEVTFIL